MAVILGEIAYQFFSASDVHMLHGRLTSSKSSAERKGYVQRPLGLLILATLSPDRLLVRRSIATGFSGWHLPSLHRSGRQGRRLLYSGQGVCNRCRGLHEMQ